MKIISYRNSDKVLYKQTLVLRDKILRQPIGLSIYDEDLSYETKNKFFGVLNESDELIGTVNYFVKSPKVAQLCAFAIKENRQKQGLGSQLITALLTDLEQKNFEYCLVSARPTAVKFYEKFGFVLIKQITTKQGGLSWLMAKKF